MGLERSVARHTGQMAANLRSTTDCRSIDRQQRHRAEPGHSLLPKSDIARRRLLHRRHQIYFQCRVHPAYIHQSQRIKIMLHPALRESGVEHHQQGYKNKNSLHLQQYLSIIIRTSTTQEFQCYSIPSLSVFSSPPP